MNVNKIKGNTYLRSGFEWGWLQMMLVHSPVTLTVRNITQEDKCKCNGIHMDY